jgi:hypothetical protein
VIIFKISKAFQIQQMSPCRLSKVVAAVLPAFQKRINNQNKSEGFENWQNWLWLVFKCSRCSSEKSLTQ